MPGPGLHQRDVASEGERRIYLVHVPDTHDSASPLPVLVVLHGGGGSAAFAHKVHGWIELSRREGCLLVFPEATCEDPSRLAGVRDNPRIWNDGSRRSAVAKRNVDDIGYLAAVLDDVQATFAVDSRRIFLTGFSNGGSMAFRAGVELSDRLAAIAPVSGHLCLDDPMPARPMSGGGQSAWTHWVVGVSSQVPISVEAFRMPRMVHFPARICIPACLPL